MSAAKPPALPPLAAKTDTNAGALRRVLRLLASVGVFSEGEDGAFALTPLGDLLRSDVPGSARAAVLLFAGVGIQDSWKSRPADGIPVPRRGRTVVERSA